MTFTFVILFLLINFFLAIVVDTYSVIKQSIEANEADKTFLIDLTHMLAYFVGLSKKKCVPPIVMWNLIKVGLRPPVPCQGGDVRQTALCSVACCDPPE